MGILSLKLGIIAGLFGPVGLAGLALLLASVIFLIVRIANFDSVIPAVAAILISILVITAGLAFTKVSIDGVEFPVSKQEDKTEEPKESNDKKDAKTSKASKTLLGKTMELTEAQEAAMVDIFTQCGIGEITQAKQFQSGEGHTSYYLEDKDTEVYGGAEYAIVVWVYDETKEVEAIHFHSQDLYVDGTVLANITDFYVPSDEAMDYRVTAELTIEPLLNYPDTAKFESRGGWSFEKENGVVTARSSVKAKNAFGMESTIPFEITFERNGITSLVLDGEELIS